MAKKSFLNTDNPAMQFISAPAEKTADAASAAETSVVSESPKAESVPVSEPPKASSPEKDIYFIPPKSAEHKSKRAQLLMTPSLHEKVAKKAASLNMSFNELVNAVLEKFVQ